jgi:hypothetical protein
MIKTLFFRLFSHKESSHHLRVGKVPDTFWNPANHIAANLHDERVGSTYGLLNFGKIGR